MDLKLLNTNIEGVYELNLPRVEDQRGSFINIFRKNNDSFKKIWGNREICQINLSKTLKKGCIRGLHLQKSPFEEAKLIHCIQGKIWDVAVDLRKDSRTFLKFFSIELSPQENNSIIIPEGCAHGFQALENNSKLIYIHSNNWIKDAEIGYRWNDPTIKIPWPLKASLISDKDQKLPLINPK